MALTPQEAVGAKEWNNIIQTEVSSAIGSKLDGKFIAANYAPGFNYAVKQRFYNEDSLAALNTLITETDGIPTVKDVYSALYKNVIGSLTYNISDADKEKISQEEQEHDALVGTIINLYKDSDLDDDPVSNPPIIYIMNRIKEVTGNDYLHLDTKSYPNLSTLCAKLSEYSRLASFTTLIQNRWSDFYDEIGDIKTHITEPTEENGGLETEKNKFYIGWNNLPETETLLKNLKNENNNIAFSISTSDFASGQSILHFDSDVSVKVPSNFIFNMKIDHEHKFDLYKYSSKGSRLDISMRFNGITTVAAVPMPVSSNHKKGWFAAEMLKEAAKKSGTGETGICLHGGEYDPDALFGENGTLRRMSTFVISQQPVINLKFSNFECSEINKFFSESTKVKFNILGGIISGEHNNDFSCSSVDYDSSRNTLDVTISPEPLGSSGSLGKQTVYVLGGTAEYFPRK